MGDCLATIRAVNGVVYQISEINSQCATHAAWYIINGTWHHLLALARMPRPLCGGDGDTTYFIIRK